MSSRCRIRSRRLADASSSCWYLTQIEDRASEPLTNTASAHEVTTRKKHRPEQDALFLLCMYPSLLNTNQPPHWRRNTGPFFKFPLANFTLCKDSYFTSQELRENFNHLQIWETVSLGVNTTLEHPVIATIRKTEKSLATQQHIWNQVAESWEGRNYSCSTHHLFWENGKYAETPFLHQNRTDHLRKYFMFKKKNPSTDYPQTLLVSNKPKEPADDSFFGATKLEHGQRVWWSAYRSPSLLGPSLAQP